MLAHSVGPPTLGLRAHPSQSTFMIKSIRQPQNRPTKTKRCSEPLWLTTVDGLPARSLTSAMADVFLSGYLPGERKHTSAKRSPGTPARDLAGRMSSMFAPAIFVRPSGRIAFGGCWSMRKSEVLEFHEREAARYRRLAANATTPSLKTRIAEQAKEHERLAKELGDELVLADA